MTDAYDKLAALYENKKRWPDLVKVLGEKADRTVDGNGKVAIYLQIANLYLERFSNQAEAIKSFEKVLELDPNNHAGRRSPARRSTRSVATGRS